MTQRTTVLRLLRERGAEGVSSHELVYKWGITRAAAIVWDLRHGPVPLNIKTIDEGQTEDGRHKLARYVLLDGQARAPRPPVDFPLGTAAPPTRPLEFDCGCVRAQDGRSWEARCQKHEGALR